MHFIALTHAHRDLFIALCREKSTSQARNRLLRPLFRPLFATRDPAVDTENIENTNNNNNNNNIVQISAQENTEHQLQGDWSNVENDANFANQRRPTARELRRDRDTAERIRIYLKVVREQLSQLAVVFGI
ncbi:MAG: hypothetical protein MHM6MM_007863 [Cercozoa sp. M6MM]